ncbi:MAG: Gfo/Idh/MocA family oxidoreductase [Phycisphaerae bacterium]|nr:Gfo/Idh/MocA family oxidoreductase [Phycisphaerae bacterium]
MTSDCGRPDRRTFLKGAAVGAAGVALSRAMPAGGGVVGANERINIGIIGCGGRGRSWHMKQAIGLAKKHNLRITAVCDVWQPALRSAAAEVEKAFGSKPFATTNYEDLLTRDDVDAVMIATPDHAHSPMLAAACKAGKDAYCEKPMTVRLEDAKDALKYARQNKRVVQIGTQRRSEGKFKAWVDFFHSGKLGKVTKAEIGYHDNGPRWRRAYDDVKEKDVDWKRYLMYLPDRPFDAKRYRRWHLYKDYTLGPVALLGSHCIDVILWYLQAKVPTSGVQLGRAYIWGEDGREHPDTCDSLWDYPEGFLCLYMNHFGNRYNDGQIAIYGTQGTFVDWKVVGTGAAEGKKCFPKPFVAAAQGDENHVENWVECMRSRKDPNAPIEAGYYHSVACVLAAESLYRGKRMVYDAGTMTVGEG